MLSLNFLSSLYWNTLSLTYRLENDVLLPPFKGSALHGIFGHALMQRKELYDALFECKTPEDHPFARRFRQMPNPHILYTLDNEKTQYRENDTLDCKLILVGNSEKYLPALVGLLMDMGKVKIGNGKAELKLHRLTEMPAFVLPPLPNVETCTLHLQFISPLRIMDKGKLADIQQFPIIVHRLAERLALLAHFYCDAPLVTDFEPWLSLAKNAKPTQTHTKHQHIPRYSHRAEMKMHLEGWQGNITFEQVPTTLLPLFYIGQELHFGKATTMGFGKFQCFTS